MRNIGLVTDTLNPLEGDELLLLQALQADGEFSVDVASWDDPLVDWNRFGTLIIRSAWDYTNSIDEFVHWTQHLARDGIDLLNPPEAIAWNANKKYLLDLAASGIPMLPTVLADKLSIDSLEIPSSETGWIVKPTIGASSKKVQKFDAGSADETRKYATELVSSNMDALIQPFAKEIENGEVSFVFFGDEYSHACIKTPAKGDFRVQHEYGGRDRYFDATPDQIAQARAVLEAVPYDLLYCRVDMVEIDDRFMLMELEAIEPYLFFGYNNAPQVFLSALKKHIASLESNQGAS